MAKDYITLPNGTDAKLVEAETIQELYSMGKVAFLGDKNSEDGWHALYSSKKLPLVFYAVPVMQAHAAE